MYTKFLVLLSVALCAIATQSPDYYSQFDGYKVIRTTITSQQQIDTIVSRNMDVWSGDSWAVIGENDIMVNNDDLEALKNAGMSSDYEVLVADVAASIQLEHDENAALQAAADADWFDSYHTYDEIVAFVKELHDSYPKLVSLVQAIGESIEGRKIPLLQISSGTTSPAKPKLLLLGGQHAREWIGPATVLYIANKMATQYGVDPVITKLLDGYDFVIVPMLNPDGYSWTFTNFRLWRKNRRQNSGGSFGVDLNRNWGNHWCESGASRNPASDTYCGTSAFSEPETWAIQNATTGYGPFGAAIDFHSYGQLIMRPYGYTSTPPNNNAQLAKVGDGMRDAMIAATGTRYTNQAIWELYLSAGSSCDWWHDDGKIPLSFGFEARDTGRYGFELPADQIKPSGEENLAAVVYLASQINA